MRIGIVGGGIAGLTAGYRLSQAGHQVVVFEALPTLGGQAGAFPIEGTRLEYYYHHIFRSDAAAVALTDELGLTPHLCWLSSKMGYFSGGRIYDFVTPLDLLRFKPLPFVSRFVLGLQGIWLQTFGDWRKLEQITAKEWVLRWGGRRIYDVLWGALLRSKYGEYADQVSMAWLWGKVVVRRSLKGSGIAKETLGYMLGSFQRLTDALADRIRSAGGQSPVAPGFRTTTMTSLNHLSLGAVGEWLCRVLLGTAPQGETPGYRRFIVCPRPSGGLTYASGAVHTVCGEIALHWRCEGGPSTWR